MQIDIPKDLVNRTVKAANWHFGKDTTEAQIEEVLARFCDQIEHDRAKEEAELNKRIAATKKIIARYNEVVKANKTLNTRIQDIPKCEVYLTNGTDRIVYGLYNLGELGYMAFSDPAHKKPAPIVPGLMNIWERIK
jgi:hypothetical protein